MLRSRTLALVIGVCAAVAVTLPAVAAPSGAAAPAASGLSARAIAQIDALSAAKAERTPTQRKIGSRLLTELQQRHGRFAAAGVGRVATGIAVDKAGRVAVSVRGDAKALVGQIAKLHGVVLDSSTSDGTVRANLPLTAVATLASAKDVTRVDPADQAILADVPGSRPLTPVESPAHVPLATSRMAAALAKVRPAAGSVTSEGDAAHAADKARAQFHVTGTGVTVGVLSDGVDSLAEAIASGDLPPGAHALPGQAGSGDEGTAMMEIVHDLAPNASLLFATVNPTAQQFAANIRALRAAGADIIVDDVIYFSESPFQDGPVAKAVTAVTNDGALYFSSAGNEGNVDDATSGNWEGDFVASGQTIGKFKGQAHDFDPGPGVQDLDPVTADSAGLPAILQWDDPLGHSGNDYDLYAVAADGTVLAFSNDTQDGNDDPFEAFSVPDGALGLAVVKFSGANRYFQLTDFRGQFRDRKGLTGYFTPGVTRGHSTVPAAFSVAAVPAADAYPNPIAPGVKNPSGPYPGVFTSKQKSEVFTSDGPRRVFYNPDGTPITPGNLSSTGGAVRQKPDITAADGVSTSLVEFDPFFGTSAAAPHAAAIAALVLSGNPGISPAAVRSALTSTAIDIETPGWDHDTGYGIVMANRALSSTGATPQPLAVPGHAKITIVTGDGDAYLEPGESADVRIPVTNSGDGPANSVSVHVATPTEGVTVTPSQRGYGTIDVGQTKKGSPFRVTVPDNFPPGESITLRVRVSFVGYLSPSMDTVTIPTGQPDTHVTTVKYTGPAVPIPDADPAGASVPLTVSGVGRVSGATFSIDGTDCQDASKVGIDHTFVGDLVGTLSAPDGTSVTLFSRMGSGGDNICMAVFDDSATKSIQDATSDDAPFTGTWQPDQALSRLVSHDGDGTWTFNVADEAAVDTGSIRAFALHLTGYVGVGA
jgi:subtilisin-like proprotein convertase family protein